VGKKSVKGAPDLVVEVVSFRSRKSDRTEKFDLYKKSGVAFYWIVDPAIRVVEAFQLVEGEYIPVGRGTGARTVQLPPFEKLQIPLGTIWPQIR
jgi:Uma2 family endonuclease